MEIVDGTSNDISADTFVQMINDLRKQNKHKWYAFVGYVNNKKVAVKGIDTWLQRFIVDSLDYPTAMDISVKQFITELNRPFNK
jgi:hypothetical protein